VAEIPTTRAPAGTSTSASRVIRSGLLSLLALLALGVTRLVHQSVVSRATSEDAYGRVALLISISTIASLLLPAGAASAAAKFIPFHRGAADPAGARGVYRFLSLLSLGGAIVLGVATALVSAAALTLSTGDAVAVGILTAAFSLYSVDKAALYGFARVTAYARLELTSAALAVVLTVVIVVTGLTAYLVPLAVGYGVFVLGTRWVLRHDVRGERGTFDRTQVLGYTALASTGTLASQGFLQGTMPLAELLTSTVQVAYLGAAVALVAPMQFLPRALGLALFPSMAEAHGAGDVAAVRTHADVSTRALLVLLAPVFAVGILAAHEMLALVFPKLTEGTFVLQLVLAATFLAVVQVAAVNALSSGTPRQVRIPVFSAVSGCFVGLLAIAMLGEPFGATGVAAGYLVGTTVTASGPIVAVWRQYDMPWAGPIARSVALVGLALAAGALLRGADNPWLDVTAAVAAAVIGALVLRRDILGVLPASLARRLPRRLGGPPHVSAEKGGDAPQ
jgi:O-antigen/teichoic acid export membrane protein